MKDYKVYKLFPTPIFHLKIENFKELNKELKNYILDLKKKDEKGQKKSNYGGWHSRFFDQKNNKILNKFSDIIQKFLHKIVLDEMGWEYNPDKIKIPVMWSIINKKGSFNIQHNHPNAYLSAAYYVQVSKNSGNIKFFDPREQKNIRQPKIKNYTDTSAVITEMTPQEGDLLIFPAYLYHSVGENLSEDDRIIISFNVDIEN